MSVTNTAPAAAAAPRRTRCPIATSLTMGQDQVDLDKANNINFYYGLVILLLVVQLAMKVTLKVSCRQNQSCVE